MENLAENITNNPGTIVLIVGVVCLVLLIIYANLSASDTGKIQIERYRDGDVMQEVHGERPTVPTHDGKVS